jgi:putative SOS response-associated peptidase YedK
VLDRSAWPRWLDGSVDAVAACSLLRPAPAGSLVARPASGAVNDVANDGPELLTPSDEPARLF